MPELEVWLCPIHESLDKRGALKPLDNCIGCLRVERDELRSELAQTKDALAEVRKTLWLGHGHIGLYGDDGEMQCNLGGCMLDFKRDPIGKIVASVLQQLAQSREDTAKLLSLLRRYTSNDHCHGGHDELTVEAENLIEEIDACRT